MNHIGRILFHFFQKETRLNQGSGTLKHGKTGNLAMNSAVPHGTDGNGIFRGLFPLFDTTMRRNALDLMLGAQVMDGLRNLTRAALPVYRVDL